MSRLQMHAPGRTMISWQNDAYVYAILPGTRWFVYELQLLNTCNKSLINAFQTIWMTWLLDSYTRGIERFHWRHAVLQHSREIAQTDLDIQGSHAHHAHTQYAVKVQRSLAPLSRFPGSHIPTAHAQECCSFQSYSNSVRSPMKLTLREPHSWDPRQRTTWSRVVTSDFNSVLPCTWTMNGEVHGESVMHNNVKRCLHKWILISIAIELEAAMLGDSMTSHENAL